ncbi:MAG: protein kinase, partial [Planctomycetota bacterium]
DFGLAKMMESGLQDTRSSLLVGTPLYMAPEQLASSSRKVTLATDIYALGVILFELLTLRTPFDSDCYIDVIDRIRSDEPIQLPGLDSRIPTDLRTICEKCVDKTPSLRYQSAEALHDDLQRFLQHEPIQAKPLSRLDRFMRWCRRPARLTQAGRYSWMYQLTLLIWVPGVILASRATAAAEDAILMRSLKDFAFVALTMHIPLGLLGWFVSCRRRWAFWPSFIGNLALLVIFFHSTMFASVAFEYNYPTHYSKLHVLVPLCMASLAAVSLYLLALPAWLHEKRP